MSSPRVSVVTTVYDRVACLTRCLRSVGRSELTDLEQVVVSDAPPTNVLIELEQVIDAAAHHVRHLDLPRRTNDWGASPAYAGLLAARGEYVCFLSDDNAYLPTHFGPLVAALDADPALGFAYSSCLYKGTDVLNYPVKACGSLDLGQPLFRRSVLLAHHPHGFDFNTYAWDWLMISRLLNAGVRWQHVDQNTFIFRLEAYPKLLKELDDHS